MFFTALLCSTALLAPQAIVAAEPADAPPSYADSLASFKQERSRAGGPKISAEDKAIMARATRDLTEQMPQPGLKVGDKAPDFTLNNALGKPVNLYAQLARGPVILSFYRGAWCPYCNLQLRGLKASLPHFGKHRAQFIAVTPQTPDKSLEQVEKDGYPFEILSDLEGRVMKAYDLYFEVPADLSDLYQRNFGLDIAAYNGPGRYVLPVPGTFVIDRDGSVLAAFAETDYTRRMEPADIIAVLEQL